MLTNVNKKSAQYDNICEEILRERAAVLSRAGIVVSDAIDLLKRLDKEIEGKISLLKVLSRNENSQNISREKQAVHEEINLIIEKFNDACKLARLKYYYLIVTREALGLRRHDRIYEFYQIPDEKKKMQAF